MERIAHLLPTDNEHGISPPSLVANLENIAQYNIVETVNPSPGENNLQNSLELCRSLVPKIIPSPDFFPDLFIEEIEACRWYPSPVQNCARMAILSRIYPCKECADHFKDVLRANPVQTGSQAEFSQWLCHAHNVVNRSLGKLTFPCQRVNARWGKLDCKDHACDLQGDSRI